jgi:hypothetical protein
MHTYEVHTYIHTYIQGCSGIIFLYEGRVDASAPRPIPPPLTSPAPASRLSRKPSTREISSLPPPYLINSRDNDAVGQSEIQNIDGTFVIAPDLHPRLVQQ